MENTSAGDGKTVLPFIKPDTPSRPALIDRSPPEPAPSALDALKAALGDSEPAHGNHEPAKRPPPNLAQSVPCPACGESVPVHAIACWNCQNDVRAHFAEIAQKRLRSRAIKFAVPLVAALGLMTLADHLDIVPLSFGWYWIGAKVAIWVSLGAVASSVR